MRTGKYLKQLAGESAIYGMSGVTAKLAALLLIPLYTRVFTPSDYGVIALIDVLFGLVGVFSVLGLDSAAARWYYDTDDFDDRRATVSSFFWCQLTASLILVTIAVAGAPSIAALVCGSSEYAGLIRLAAAALLLHPAAGVLGRWLRYQRRAWASVTFTTTSLLGRIGLIILFVLVWRKGLTGLYAARLIAAIVTGAVAIVILRSWIAAGAFSWARLRSMLHYSLPLVPAAIGAWVMVGADRFILTAYWETSEVGLYCIAVSVASGVALITTAFQQAWGPFAFSILKETDSKRVYSRVLDLYSFLGCLVCTGLALFAPLVLRLLTTEVYYPAASCVAFITFAFLFKGATYIAVLGSAIAKKSVPIALSVGVGAAVNIALNFLLIPRFGRNGAAVATMAAFCCSVAYLFAASQKNYRIPYKWRIGLACLSFSWVLIGMDWWLVPAHGATGFAIRIGMLLLFAPLGAFLGLIKWTHFRPIIGHTGPATQSELEPTPESASLH